MTTERLQAEIENLKSTTRFFIKINLGALASLFAFFSFLSSDSNQAINIAIKFKIIIGVLLSMLVLGFYCEYLASLKNWPEDYKSVLENRIKYMRLWLKIYVFLWIIPISIVAYLLMSINVMHDVTI